MDKALRILFGLTWAATAVAQSPLTLERAVEQALERYPGVKVSLEEVSAAAAGVNLARTAYLPRVDFLSQINRATRNNVYGMLLPQSALPAISGPPLPGNSATNVWGTATGFLVSWEPFDFGLRKAGVDAATMARRHSEAAAERTKFDVAATAADAFLTILAARQTEAAAEAGVERARVLHEAAATLARAGLRPGADESRARAELSMADTQRIQARQAYETACAALSRLSGEPVLDVDMAATRFLALPNGAPPSAASAEVPSSHPLLREQDAAVEESRARGAVLNRSYYPKFAVQSGLYARGTGANPDFTTGGAAAGLGPNVHNWGVGLTMSIPLMDYASLRARKQGESHRERAGQERYRQLQQDLRGQLARAQAMLQGARRIARNTPVQLEAARAAGQQAAARYKAGLAPLTEVAEAQRLLTQTEIDHSLAALQVWRGMLAVAVAQGDIGGFVAGTR